MQRGWRRTNLAASGSTDRPPGNRAGKEGNMSRMARSGGVAAAIILLTWISAESALAHCDTMDGPVVILAKKALEKGDVTLILPGVAKEKEGGIREAFDLTSAVRGKGAKGKELAARSFFETLVRVHREAEGAPFTGLKPAGLARGPAIPAADKALETGNPKALLALIEEKIHEGIHQYYVEEMERKKHAGESGEAGRAYVQAYVPYLHFVERLYLDASTPVTHGGEEGTHDARLNPGAAAEHKH